MRERHKTTIAATLAGATLALAGCGPFGGESDEDKAGDTVTELFEARNAGDFARVCELFAAQAVETIEQSSQTDCASALGEVGAQGAATVRLDEVRVEGDRATVDATAGPRGQGGQAQTVLLVKEDGEWKVAATTGGSVGVTPP